MGTRTGTLTAKEARKLTSRIRDALALADDLLVKAWEGRAWEALGHESWELYCAKELPALRMLRLGKVARTERVQKHAEQGMSTRAIASAYGISAGTVRNDLEGFERPAEVVSLDGRRRPSRVTPAPDPAACRVTPAPVSNVARAVALVAAQGSHGLTVHELCAETGWHHGSSSSALTKAHQRGLLVRLRSYRQRCAVYLRP